MLIHLKQFLLLLLPILMISLLSCSPKVANLTSDNLVVKGRDIIPPTDGSTNPLHLNHKVGDGLAILKEVSFTTGTVELEIKGEDNPGKSFVGFAFNIQNDSTFEAVYFRPFNFRADEQIRREHSLQYISLPKNTWRYLRTNFEGQYEGEFPRTVSPEDWFSVRLKIDREMVYVYDVASNSEILRVKRIEKPKSNKIGLWTGMNSKGEFRNLKLRPNKN